MYRKIKPVSLARLAYGVNIFILLPVLIFLIPDQGRNGLIVFQGLVQNEDGLRLLIACFWFAIFILSIAGLRWPQYFLPVLIFQVIYKLSYLLIFILPMLMTKGVVFIPMGISISFILIVLIWPFIIWVNLK